MKRLQLPQGKPYESCERCPLRPQGVPSEVPRRLHEEAPQLPHVAQVTAEGEAARGPTPRDPRAHVVGPLPPHVEEARPRAPPVPPGNGDTNRRLKQPPKNSSTR